MPQYGGEFVPEFHPEFGYLVPSRKGRRTVRVALAAAAFGIVTGAVGAMVLLPRAGHDLRVEQAFTAMQGDTVTVGLAVTSPPAATSGRRPAAPKAAAAPPAADTDKPCKDETWPYFDRKCLWGGPRKDATVAETPAETPAAAPVEAEVAAANPPEQRPVVAKKKARTTNTTARRRSKKEPDPRAAYANPNPYGSPYSQPYGNPYGSWRTGGYEPRRDWGW